jgi:hypothetical protein
MVPRLVLFGVRSQKLSNVDQSLDGSVNDQKFIISSSTVLSKGTLSRWSRLHLQSLAPTKPHWARVVGYGPFSFCMIHKEGLCPAGRHTMMMI